jgi:5-amino-6-(5-phospho-D-ribitylamino)uracil phosphatase
VTRKAATQTPAVNKPKTAKGRWLIALDVDGTVLHEDGTLSDAVITQVQRAQSLGNVITLCTGRSADMTLPILERLGITPEYVVCANGAITLKRDEDAPTATGPVGYSRAYVDTFDPAEVLTTIRTHLDTARYAVEDDEGHFLFSGGDMPEWESIATGRHVEFEELLGVRATRVVVISPEHAIEDFLKVVERMGLHRVSYNVGWTAWLDIAPDGVNKAVALERVRDLLDIPRTRVMAVGDGRNDIEMLEWAAAEGRGVAMGQAPREVKAVANETTGTDLRDGVAMVLKKL